MIAHANDSYEEEADRLASEIPAGERAGAVQTLTLKAGRSGSPTGADGAPDSVGDVLRSSGQPLDGAVREFFEPGFGHDFSQVRIHADARAAESAREVDALAYTVGKNIVFGAGRFDPGTDEGKHLLAHELAHVIQQAQATSLASGPNGKGSAAPESGFASQPVLQRQGRALTEKERRERRRERRALRRAERRGTRGRRQSARQGETAQEPAALKLLTFTETANPNLLTLPELKNSQVGHTWIELSLDDPDDVPDGVGRPTEDLLKLGGTAFGFWPLINRTQDLTGDELSGLLAEVRERETQGLTPGAGFTERPLVGYSINPFASFVPGRVEEPDDSHAGEQTAEQEFDLSVGEVSSLMRYVNGKRNAVYSLFKYNCTTFALEAVQAAGHTPPSGATLGIKLPNALRRDLFRLEREAGVAGDPTITLYPPVGGSAPKPKRSKG